MSLWNLHHASQENWQSVGIFVCRKAKNHGHIIESYWPITHSPILDEEVVDEQVSLSLSSSRRLLGALLTSLFSPISIGSLRCIALVTVLTIFLHFVYVKQGKSEVVCIQCMLNMLAT